jgi:hypothetical protein
MEVAKTFVSGADRVMQPLRALSSLDRRNLRQVVGCHTQLMDRVKKVTGTWTVSFCSKYLSFHFPDVAPEATLQAKPGREVEMGPEQFLVLVTCRDEKHQVELLERFKGEGLECKALLS